jgi:hypothetical protein
MADSKISGLTQNTVPEARDLFYNVDLSEATVADRSKYATLADLMNSVIILDLDVVCEICTLDGNLVTL